MVSIVPVVYRKHSAACLCLTAHVISRKEKLKKEQVRMDCFFFEVHARPLTPQALDFLCSRSRF